MKPFFDVFIRDLSPLDEKLKIAKQFGGNLDVLAFALPPFLDGDVESLLQMYKAKLEEFEIRRVCIHGPFYDLALSSPDKKIVQCTKDRYMEGMEAATILGAESIVFHSQFNPLIGLSSYTKSWIDESAKFIKDILSNKRYSDISIFIENMFEGDPSPLRELMERVSSPRVKVCLDVAHINVYGRGSYEKWIRSLAPFIGYIHISDNDGDIDSHLPLGKGHINFHKVFSLLGECCAHIDICLELEKVEDTLISIDFLKKEFKWGEF